MRVVFRADASFLMGTGHLIRCLTLAEVMRQRGAEVEFICRDHPGNLLTFLQQKDIPVTILPAPSNRETSSDGDYAAWLGVTQGEDASQSIASLIDRSIDCLVVDHYGLDSTWEKQVRPYVKKLMVIDDLGNRNHECDVILDQSFTNVGAERYTGLVPQECQLLIGPMYALLNPEYALARARQRGRNTEIKNVLVYFGGSDPDNMTELALIALSDPRLSQLTVDIVVGANYANRVKVEELAAVRGRARILGSQPHLADLMAKADLAIGAGGTTTWERICLGLPSIVVTIAENQQPSTKALADIGLIQYIGHSSSVTPSLLVEVINNECNRGYELFKTSQLCQLLVDGLGVFRVLEILWATDSQEIYLRPASGEDIALFFTWANDPLVRENAHNTLSIPWSVHEKWFEKKLHNENCWLYVLEASGLPVGQIRFDRCGDEVLVDYSLDSIVRGRNWGQRLISLGIDCMVKEIPHLRLKAEVKKTNKASASVFRRVGFSESVSSSSEVLVFSKESTMTHTEGNC